MPELSPFLLQKYTHLFKILDFDHDGSLLERDFTSLAENVAIFRCSDENDGVEELLQARAESIWKAIKEFMVAQEVTHCTSANWAAFLQKMVTSETPERIDVFIRKCVRDIFSIFDKNNDDIISKSEYLCFFVSMRVGIKQADECFRMLDLNGDQKISKNELFLAIRQYFLSEEVGAAGNLLFGNPEAYQFERKVSYLYA